MADKAAEHFEQALSSGEFSVPHQLHLLPSDEAEAAMNVVLRIKFERRWAISITRRRSVTRPNSVKCGGGEFTAKRRLVEFVVALMLIGAPIVAPSRTACAQADPPSIVRLFRLEGTFSEEAPPKNGSDGKATTPGFVLAGARLEADNIGFLTRLRATLTIANKDAERRITEVEWRLDVYDASLRSIAARVPQSKKVNIYAGETAAASERFGAVLPDRMVVLLQLTRISFADGSSWSSTEDCFLEPDLRTVVCKGRPK